MKINDLINAVDRAVARKPAKFLQMPWGWILVVFFDSGIVDHGLRQAAGHESGKGELRWYDRHHEVIGYGKNPQLAAHSILSGERGARLRAYRAPIVGENRIGLFFRHLDSQLVYQPTPMGLALVRDS